MSGPPPPLGLFGPPPPPPPLALSGLPPPPPLGLSGPPPPLLGLFGKAEEAAKPIILFDDMRKQFLTNKNGVYTFHSENPFQSILFVQDKEKSYVVKLGNRKEIPERENLTKFQLIEKEEKIYDMIQGSPYFPKKIEYDVLRDFNYLIIEYIEGKTLYDFVFEFKEKRLTLDKIYSIGLDITNAINELYNKGYTHGDLSPHNIMIKDDFTIVLIDFERAAQSKDNYEYFDNIRTNMKGDTGADQGYFQTIYKTIEDYKNIIETRNAPIPGYIFLVGILIHLLDDKESYKTFLESLWTELTTLTTNFNIENPYDKCIKLFEKEKFELDVAKGGGGGGGSQRKTRKSQKGGRRKNKKIESRKAWKRKSKVKCQRKLL